MMRILLKQNWDYPSSYDRKDKVGNFVGRKREKDRLKDEFLRKDSGSILVAGVRGVGKTSLVYQSVQEAVAENKNIIPIVINASQLELYSGSTSLEPELKTLPEIILKNLIRRLYGYFHLNNLQSENSEKLGVLYRKAVSKDFNITTIDSDEDTGEEQETAQTSTSSSFKIDKDYLLKVVPFIAGTVVLFLPAFYSHYVNLVVGIVLFLLPTFAFSTTKEVINRALKKKTNLKSAQRVYQEDASLSNLESELNNLLRDLASEGVRVIFIIDELDKLEKESDNGASIFQIIKTYKNLFTLSSALFVFISGDKVYQALVSTRKNKEAPYTLFTNRIFINRPSFNDLEEFIDSIIDKIAVEDGKILNSDFANQLAPEDLRKLKDFKNYLCYKARSDYFELYYILRDFVEYFYDDGVQATVSTIDLSNFGTSFDDRLQGKLQKVLGQVYERNCHNAQSDWHRNDSILNALYDFLEKTYNRPFEFDFDLEGEHDRMMGEYLLAYLERLEIITRTGKKTNYPDGKPGDLVAFQWTGNIPGEGGIPDIKTSPDILFQEESELVEVGKKYIQQVNDIDDLPTIIRGQKRHQEIYDIDFGVSDQADGRKLTGINAHNIYEKYEDALVGLTGRSPQHIPREELKAFIKELKQEVQKLKDVSWTTFTNLIRDAFTVKSVKFNESPLPSAPHLLDILPSIRDFVINNNVPHIVFFQSEDGSKRLLITQNLNPEALSSEALATLEENKAFKIINLQTDPALDYSKTSEVVLTREVKVKKLGKEETKTQTYNQKVSGFHNILLEEDYLVFRIGADIASGWLQDK